MITVIVFNQRYLSALSGEISSFPVHDRAMVRREKDVCNSVICIQISANNKGKNPWLMNFTTLWWLYSRSKRCV